VVVVVVVVVVEVVGDKRRLCALCLVHFFLFPPFLFLHPPPPPLTFSVLSIRAGCVEAGKRLVIFSWESFTHFLMGDRRRKAF